MSEVGKTIALIEALKGSGGGGGGSNKFIVTLTPTALDYSGTMDHTVAEINAAYDAGMEIVFRLTISANEHADLLVNAGYYDGTSAYPSFEAMFLGSAANMFVSLHTGTTDDGTQQTYSTAIYSLTPAS